MQPTPFGLIFGQWQHRRDGFAGCQRQQVVEAAALGLRAADRQLPDLLAVHLAGTGKKQHRIVRRCHEQVGDNIFILGRHARTALAAAALGAVFCKCDTLDPARMGNGDHHVFAFDQVFIIKIIAADDDFATAFGGKFVADFLDFGAQHGVQLHSVAENFEQAGNGAGKFLQLIADFFTAQRGQLGEPQLKDGANLDFAQSDRGGIGSKFASFDKVEIGADFGRIPIARHERFTGIGRAGRTANGAHDLIEIGNRDDKADQDVRPLARLGEFELGAPGNHFLAELHKGLDDIAQAHQFGATAANGEHVDAEGLLRRRVAVDLVEHDLGGRVALQFHDDAHAFAIRFVAQIGNAFDPLVLDRIGDLFDQRILALLERDFGQHQAAFFAAAFLNDETRADDDGAAPGFIGGAQASGANDQRAGGEIGCRQMLHQIFDADRLVIEPGADGIDDFAQIVRRDIGCHADSNARGAVDQKVGKTRRQHNRLGFRTIVIVLKVDCILVDIGEQRFGGLGQPCFGVAHRGGRIGVHRAEIALAIDQRQAQRPILRHPRQRIVNRAIAMRVIFTHHVTNDTRRFAIGLVRREAAFMRAPQDAAMHRLQAITHIGQRA